MLHPVVYMKENLCNFVGRLILYLKCTENANNDACVDELTRNTRFKTFDKKRHQISSSIKSYGLRDDTTTTQFPPQLDRCADNYCLWSLPV